MAKAIKYEFGGPAGALGVILGCPTITYLLHVTCAEMGCPPKSLLQSPIHTFTTELWPGWAALWDARVVGWYVCWFFVLVVLQYTLPGAEGEGTVLRNGQRLKYKFNAFATFASVVAYCGVETYRHGFEWELWQWLWEHAVHLVTASTLFATAQAFYTYISSFSKDELLAEHGDTGNPIYDFYIGRPLNPRIGSFDLKVFSELRPGMILWIILNFSYLAHQHTTHGRITDSMILVNLFQAWYVSDALWNEPAVLTTMDVVTDGFGYMLSFGDLVWVPFTYSLQARYLALYPVDLGLWGVLAVLAVQAIGYIVFRGANGQKNAFRRDPLHPDVSHLRYITTKSGSRLMISGWWGLARHVNYLGDWLMAWAWCLPTGFGSPIPYFYVAYFAVLLVHRERRDEAKCKAKYGEDWDRYTKIVPYRIVPGVY